MYRWYQFFSIDLHITTLWHFDSTSGFTCSISEVSEYFFYPFLMFCCFKFFTWFGSVILNMSMLSIRRGKKHQSFTINYSFTTFVLKVFYVTTKYNNRKGWDTVKIKVINKHCNQFNCLSCEEAFRNYRIIITFIVTLQLEVISNRTMWLWIE